MAHSADSNTFRASIPRDCLYQLSQPFLDLVYSQRVGLQGLRLAHLIAHTVCRRVPDWHNLANDQPVEGFRQECVVFRRHLGLEQSNGNRALETGIASLQDSRLFGWIEFVNDNHWLAWRLKDGAFDLLFGQERYGHFDICDLRGFRTPLDLMMFGQLGIVRGMRRPEVTLSLDGFASLLKRAPEWHRMQTDIMRALQRSAARFGVGCVVLLECRGMRRGIDTITVRLYHQRKGWGWKRLTGSSEHYPARKVLLLNGETFSEVSRQGAATAAYEFFTTQPTSGGESSGYPA